MRDRLPRLQTQLRRNGENYCPGLEKNPVLDNKNETFFYVVYFNAFDVFWELPGAAFEGDPTQTPWWAQRKLPDGSNERPIKF